MFAERTCLHVMWFILLFVPNGNPGVSEEPPAPAKIIKEIRIIGTRRVPSDTVKFHMLSQKNTLLDPNLLDRDFKAVWATGFFDDLKIELEEDDDGIIVLFQVKEKPLVRDIKYDGLKSATLSEVLDKLKEKRVGLGVETPFDPSKVQRAIEVLKELLASKGHQYATITYEAIDVPPSAKQLRFLIDEGPKVKVKAIRFHGNTVYSERQLRQAMKYIKEKGFLSNITGKSTYDQERLEASLETGVRVKYNEKGYVRLVIHEPRVEIQEASGIKMFSLKFRRWKVFPFPYGTWSGKHAFIDTNLDEGHQYRLGNVSFSGNTQFRRDQLLYVFGTRPGEIFNGELIKKGFENVKKLYGARGFINWTPIVHQDFDEEDKLVNRAFDFEEDRQFTLRHLDFVGNNSTRDYVIRREILVNEGEIFNSALLDISLLRLNQLGYFDVLKTEDAEIKPDLKLPEVDVILKVKEKGRNSIGFTGGVSGYGGSYLGLNYSTQNFLGRGEVFDFMVQGGSRTSAYVFSFTEPYFQDIPLTTGFSIFHRRYSNRQGDLYGGVYGYVPLGRELFAQQSTGFSVFASHPVRPFTRIGLTYSLDRSSTAFSSPQTAAFFTAFQYTDIFTGRGNYTGLLRSKVTPSLTYNTINNPFQPSSGKSLTAAIEVVGGPLGGGLMYYRPIVEAKWFKPVNQRRNAIGIRAQFVHVSGYGGLQPPVFDRTFMGGEDSIRGFDFYSISPMALMTQGTTGKVPDRDAGGFPIVDPTTGEVLTRERTTYSSFITPIGGDTQVLVNMEYRIPLLGPVSMAPFVDWGKNWVAKKSSLQIANPESTSYYVLENGTFRHMRLGDPIPLVAGSERFRSTVGLEFQVILPMINAPFRIILGYNPSRFNSTIARPESGTDFYYREKNHDFRFTVGRTF